MLIMSKVGGGGSFAELHPFDVRDDIVLIGHDGPHNINISNEKPVLRKLKKFHGKPGTGVSVEFKLKTGPIIAALLLGWRRRKVQADIRGRRVYAGRDTATGNTNSEVPLQCTRDRIRPNAGAPRVRRIISRSESATARVKSRCSAT